MQACDYFSPALKNTLICVFQSECVLWKTEHRERTMTGLFVVLLVGAGFAGLTWLMVDAYRARVQERTSVVVGAEVNLRGISSGVVAFFGCISALLSRCAFGVA